MFSKELASELLCSMKKQQMKDAIRANRFPKATFAQTIFYESAHSDIQGDESRRQTLPTRQTAVGKSGAPFATIRARSLV